MKKIKITKQFKSIIILVLLIQFSITSCGPNKQEIKESIDELSKQKISLTSENNSLNDQVNSKKSELSSLDEKLKELKIYESGKTPKYILKLHLKQSHFSFSIKKHIKDAINAIDFEMPVDRDFYNNISVGSEIVNNFRIGSCILYGSFGDWSMTVKGKEIRN